MSNEFEGAQMEQDEAYGVILSIFRGDAPELPSSRMCLAAHSGDEAAVRAALAAGEDVNRPDFATGLPPLFHARDGKTTKLLLDYGAHANATVAGGRTALMDAAVNGEARKVQALLSADQPVGRRADVHARDVSGRSALALAALDDPLGKLEFDDWEAKAECVAALLNAGAKPRQFDLEGRPALGDQAVAAFPESLRSVFDFHLPSPAQRLIDAMRDGQDAGDAERKAASGGVEWLQARQRRAEALADASALMKQLPPRELARIANEIQRDGASPLRVAVDTNNVGLAGRMLAHGASPAEPDLVERTLAHWVTAAEVERLAPRHALAFDDARAADQGWLELADRAGADFRLGDEQGRAPLHEVSGRLLEARGRDAALAPLAAFLVRRGADPTEPDRAGSSPLGEMLAAGSTLCVDAALAAAERDQDLADGVLRMTTREEFTKLRPAARERIEQWIATNQRESISAALAPPEAHATAAPVAAAAIAAAADSPPAPHASMQAAQRLETPRMRAPRI